MNKIARHNKREVHDLEAWLGRREAYSLVAGTCSAAQAKCLHALRQQKEYRKLGLNWDEFCKRRIGMHRSKADEIIRQWTEFGPSYFTLAQVTGITAEDYRALGGSVSGGALLLRGESIPIEADAGPRLVAAVEELKKMRSIEAAATPAAGLDRALQQAERLLRRALGAVEHLETPGLNAGGRMRLQALAGSAASKLKNVEEWASR